MSERWLQVQYNCTERINESLATLRRMTDKTACGKPWRGILRKRFALYSGGNDSMCSTHLAMNNGWADEVLHIDTQFGIRKTHEHAVEVMRSFGWPYRVVTPPDWGYRDIVLRKGFPGPAAHRYCYVWLKERAIAQVVRETKKGFWDKVALITGVRNTESARRMGYNTPLVRKDARLWTAPIFTWSKADCERYRRYYNLPNNPVSDILGYSAECLCGAFAKDGEIALIDKHFPCEGLEIHLLEQEAKKAGKHCVWGTRPPKEPKRDQGNLFMPACASCSSRQRVAVPPQS